jgi:uncharacterized protein involved in outer membrane biogenesis
MRRRLVIVAMAAALVLVLGVLVVVWSLDSILKGVIEDYGSKATKVAVHADSVALSLLGGSAAISDLTVANPSGFSSANVFRLGKIQLLIDCGTIRSNPLVINAITIVAPEVHFEVDQNGESNVDVIRRNLSQFRSAASGAAPASPGPSQPTPAQPARQEPAEAQRFLIKKLSIQEAQLVIDTSALGGERRLVKLPDTEETDIGARSGGATGGEVATVVVRALVRDVAATVAAAQVERALEKSVGGEAGKALGEGVGEAVKGVGRALNKIFGDRDE